MSKARTRRKRGEMVSTIGVVDSMDPQAKLGYRWHFYTQEQISAMHLFGAPAAYAAVELPLSEVPESVRPTARDYADDAGWVWVRIELY